MIYSDIDRFWMSGLTIGFQLDITVSAPYSLLYTPKHLYSAYKSFTNQCAKRSLTRFFFLKPFQKFWPFRFHLTYTLPLWCHYTSLLRMHPVKVVVQVLINSSSVLFTKLHNSHNNLLTIMYQYMLKFIILSLICLDPLSLFTKKLRHHNCVKLIEGTYISFYNIEVTTLTENPSSA